MQSFTDGITSSHSLHNRARVLDKFLTYRRIEALQEFALVDPHAKTFEVYRRQPNLSDWLLAQGQSEQGLLLHSVALTLPLDALFANV
ncbi:MAG: Uma2 family endonuclease [Comamonadaceae bacterium]|nr:Uma2 family endonuclease [Comamonadaceae bacterium]